MYACYNLLINTKSCIVSKKKQLKVKKLNFMSFIVYTLLCYLKMWKFDIFIPQPSLIQQNFKLSNIIVNLLVKQKIFTLKTSSYDSKRYSNVPDQINTICVCGM